MAGIEEVIQCKVDYIFDEARIKDWLILKQAIPDDGVLQSDDGTFTINMKAAYVQLLGGAMMKSQGAPLAIEPPSPPTDKSSAQIIITRKGFDLTLCPECHKGTMNITGIISLSLQNT